MPNLCFDGYQDSQNFNILFKLTADKVCSNIGNIKEKYVYSCCFRYPNLLLIGYDKFLPVFGTGLSSLRSNLKGDFVLDRNVDL
jgi:hypothetical protein